VAELPTIDIGGTPLGELRIQHEVGVDQLTGRATLTVPLDLSAGRDGTGPQLALRYDSSGAHSPFGAGWSLEGLLTVTVSTRSGLPTYDARDRYSFTMTGELVQELRQQGGQWLPRVAETASHTVRYFRGRRESAHIRVEQWTEKATGRVHWRTRDAGDVVTVYGRTARIAESDDRIYAWLPEEQYDPEGNAVVFEWAAETADGIDTDSSFERSRAPCLTQRYLKRIRYGNSHPLAADIAEPAGNRWHFEVVLDYGDHAAAATPAPDRLWPARPDPRSSYRPGFEIRTHRLCRRVLQFHHFDELGSRPVRVCEYRLEHDTGPLGATLTTLRYAGFNADGSSRELPPLRFRYTVPTVDAGFLPAPAETAQNAPAGLATGFRWIDLYGDGLPGILSETPDAWYFKPNEGGGRFGAQHLVLDRPAYSIGEVALVDFDADGNPNLAVLHGRSGGYYAYDRDASLWQGFRPFQTLPHLEAAGSRAQWLDLSGDGRADLIVGDGGGLTWYPSLGPDGFGDPVAVTMPAGITELPPLAEDREIDYFFADMTGDGLADQVRVRNGRVEYWPQLGHGRFGAPVLMEGAPRFASDAEFDAGRLFLVDLTGDGLADLLYVGAHRADWWLNASGNSLVEGGRLDLPTVDRLAQVQVLDFLGDGTPCLVWSSPLPDTADAIRYLRLTRVPPNLLVAVDNGMGAEDRLTYSTSGAHYFRDRAAGRPWRTRLPSHHAVVDRHELLDHIGGASSATRYIYHDGRFDADEQIVLFGAVDRFDADELPPGTPPETATTAPACVRSWFHPGIEVRGTLPGSYLGDQAAPLLPPHAVEDLASLAPGDYEQAVAALAGSPLREEVYAVGPDGQPDPHPITVTQYGYRVRRLQPRRGTAGAGSGAGAGASDGSAAAATADPAYLFFESERLDLVYEGDPTDPRVAHHATLDVDDRGSALASCALAYPRRASVPAASAAQQRLVATGQRLVVTHLDTTDRYELGIPIESREYELTGLTPDTADIVSWARLRAEVLPAMAAAVRFHEPLLGGQADTTARSIGWLRNRYWNGTRTAALPTGQVGAPTLLHHAETACFTPELIDQIFAGDVPPATLTGAHYALADGHWWSVGDTLHYHGPDHFYLTARAVRGDSATARISYDAANLHPLAAVDAVGNTTQAELDYVHLEPFRITDANGNVTESLLDPLGVAIVTTSFGRIRGPSGQPADYGQDPLSDYSPVAAPTFAAVLANPAAFVQNATGYVYYELAWSPGNPPPRVLDLTREDLAHDGTGTAAGPSRVDIQVAHLDGFRRELQTKHLVEPGDAILRNAAGRLVLGPDGQPTTGPVPQRWQASGHVGYNRKQEPVREHEPFFSSTPDYEPDAAALGVAHVCSYDAMGRPVRTDAPNGTLTRTSYTAWASTQFDANDTVLESDYRVVREGLPPSDPQRQAYEQAKAHANTPSVVHVDPAGRAVLRVEIAATGPDEVTHTQLDARGAEVAVIDPRGIAAFALRRDMQSRVLRTDSADAGVVRALPDAYDRLVHSWDSRGVHIHRSFDLLDRPRTVDVDGALGLNHRTEEFDYGETFADAALRNAHGQLVVHRDQAGTLECLQYGPGGEVLRIERRLRTDFDREPDWAGAGGVPLEPDRYVSEHRYDAMGRLHRQLLPDGTDRQMDYLSGGGLAQLTVSTDDGRVTDLVVCSGARYTARGQRTRVVHGNGVEVTHSYDPETFLTSRISVRRGTTALQDIGYVYDPAGNITRREDAAQRPAGPIINGLTVTPESIFVYDEFYQLRSATGRVHQALLEHDYRPKVSDPGAMKGTRHLTLNNGAAVERYTRTYTYDLGGNLVKLKHVGASRTWTTDLWVSATSNRSVPALDPAGNPVPNPESAFDEVGNCRRLAHLRAIDYSYRNAITRSVVIDRSGSGQPDDAEFYVYDGDGLRVRKVSQRLGSGGLEITDLIYLDGCEIKRIRSGNTPTLARITSHLSDAENRIAQLHRWSLDTAGRETDDLTAVRVRYELTDHLGSAELALDESGQVIAYEEYFPYGGTAFVAGDAVREVQLRDYRFCGKERDDATGMYYFGYRYYAPWIGRWISPDPIGPEDDLNLYRYCLNNPVVHTDPMGLQTTDTRTQQRGRHIKVSTPRLPKSLHGFTAKPGVTEPLNRGELVLVRLPGSPAPIVMPIKEYEDLVQREIAAGRTARTFFVVPGLKPGAPGEQGGQQPAAAPDPDDSGAGTAEEPVDVGETVIEIRPPEGPDGAEQGDDGTGGQQLGPDGNPTDATGTSDSGDGGQSGVHTGTGGSRTNNSPTGPGAGSAQGRKRGPGAGPGGAKTGGRRGERRGPGGRQRVRNVGAGGQRVGAGAGSGELVDSYEGVPGGVPGGLIGGEVGGVPGGTTGGSVGGILGGLGSLTGADAGTGASVIGGNRGGASGGTVSAGQTANGDDPNGTRAGAPSSIRSGAGTGGGQGAGQTGPAGQPGGQGTGAGGGTGEHRGEQANGAGGPAGSGDPGGPDGAGGDEGGTGGTGGTGGGTPTGWDRAAQIAGYAELEFGGGEGGQSGGIPGGMGFLRGRGWQALYIGLAAVGLIGGLVKMAGKLGLKALGIGLRKAFAAVVALFTKKFWRAAIQRAARYFTRRFWRNTWRRFLRTGFVRFLRDPRTWKTVSRWRRAGRGWVTGWELHHWVFPQRWRFIPQWARNAGFNLVLVPKWLNGYMGRTFAVGSARWFLSRGLENFIRVAIPASLVGGGYGGYRLGTWLDQLDESPPHNPRVPQQSPARAQPTP
jgi:RHS repeat-associated protein